MHATPSELQTQCQGAKVGAGAHFGPQEISTRKFTKDHKHLLLWCPVLVSVVFFWQARRSKKLEKKALAHYKETQKVDLNKLP